MNVRSTLGSTVVVTASALRHLRWWLDWHSRARPTDGGRGSE
jgi:hypothetical protein